jgi:HEAT repeat protein
MRTVTDEDMRMFALLALEQLALPQSRATFLDALSDENDTVRPIGLRGLFLIRDPQAICAAEDAYRTGNTVTKQVALFCLNRTATDDTIGSLQRLLDAEQSWRWRRAIKKALRQARSKGPRPIWDK